MGWPGEHAPSITVPDPIFAECIERSIVGPGPIRPPAPAVRLLGHGSWSAREAMERYLGRRPDRLEIVRGLSSRDAEVRHRCARLLSALAPCYPCRGAGCILCDHTGSIRPAYFPER